MSDAKPVEVEFTIPQPAEFADETLRKLWAFNLCLAQWVDGESQKRCGATSRQVMFHRLLSAVDVAPVVRWRQSDWQFVCQLLEDTEIDFIPPLSAQVTKEDGTVEPQKIEPPPFLTRRYLGAILGAKVVGEAPVADEPVAESAVEPESKMVAA